MGLLACSSAGVVIDLPETGTDASLGGDASLGTGSIPATSNIVPVEPCTPGHERIVVTTKDSVHVLTRGVCLAGYEAGLPSASAYWSSELGPWVFRMDACDDAGAFSAQAELSGMPGPLTAPDAALTANLDYATLGSNNTELTFDDWPDAGGLMSGSFAGTEFLKPSVSISGTFCVVWSPPP
jgi:hypothetical protein